MTKTLVGHPDQPDFADVHAERAVLGAILLYPANAPVLVSLLAVADFTLVEHQQVFKATGALTARGRRCDPMNVAQVLAEGPTAGQQRETTTLLIHQLVRSAPVEPLVMTYTTIVSTLAALRRTRPGPAPLRGFLIDDQD